MRKIMHSLTRNFNSRWPAPFMINDLHPWFLGGRTDSESVSSSTGGRGMGGEEEDEEEEISHLLQHVTALHSFLCFLLCGKQAWERISSVCLSMHLHIFIFVCTHARSFPYSEWKSFLMVVYISIYECIYEDIHMSACVSLLFALVCLVKITDV